MPVDPKLISIYEFATMSGLSVRTLERLDHEGQLPRRVPITAGRRVLRVKRWSHRSVVEWIQRRGDAVKVAV